MIQPLQVKPQEELKRFWKQHLDGWTGGIGGLLLDPVEKDEGTRKHESRTSPRQVSDMVMFTVFTV
jgi:hypothetical protein